MPIALPAIGALAARLSLKVMAQSDETMEALHAGNRAMAGFNPEWKFVVQGTRWLKSELEELHDDERKLMRKELKLAHKEVAGVLAREIKEHVPISGPGRPAWRSNAKRKEPWKPPFQHLYANIKPKTTLGFIHVQVSRPGIYWWYMAHRGKPYFKTMDYAPPTPFVDWGIRENYDKIQDIYSTHISNVVAQWNTRQQMAFLKRYRQGHGVDPGIRSRDDFKYKVFGVKSKTVRVAPKLGESDRLFPQLTLF